MGINVFGPYEAKKDGTVDYIGNKVFPKVEDVHSKKLSTHDIENRVNSLHDDRIWPAITRINNRLNTSITEYFNSIGALFVPLPLTTRMISSPGAVYGKEVINYTTDTCPITLDWFDLPNKAFLAESSQIYLELTLLQKGIDHVFANYHSFRKEPSDSTHLSEFHHVEYEGHVSQLDNLKIINDMLRKAVYDIVNNNKADLEVFLSDEKIKKLSEEFMKVIPKVTLINALELLHQDTQLDKYSYFGLKEFGSWEETRITQIIGGTVAVTEMPLLEVPFYHAQKNAIVPAVADNADILGGGYREIMGSGHRVTSIAELERKATLFNLPKNDYEPYLQSRRFPDYKETSGFGMGWERFIQFILEMPFIYSASLFPRIHSSLKP